VDAGKLKDPRSVEPLLLALQDWFFNVREAAAYALGGLGDPRAVEPLIKALGDTHGKVREAAAWSLGKFGDHRAVDPLLKPSGIRIRRSARPRCGPWESSGTAGSWTLSSKPWG